MKAPNQFLEPSRATAVDPLSRLTSSFRRGSALVRPRLLNVGCLPAGSARAPTIAGWSVSHKTFDRNSQVRFHKCMEPTGLQNALVHGLVHGQLFNHS